MFFCERLQKISGVFLVKDLGNLTPIGIFLPFVVSSLCWFLHTYFRENSGLTLAVFFPMVLPTPNYLWKKKITAEEPLPPSAPSPPTPPAWWRKAPPRWRPQGRVRRPRKVPRRARQGEAPGAAGVKTGGEKKVPFQAGNNCKFGICIVDFLLKNVCLLFAILKYHWKKSF